MRLFVEDIDVPDGEGELPPRYEEIVEGDAAAAAASSDKSKFNITNPIKSIMKKDKSKVREPSRESGLLSLRGFGKKSCLLRT